VRSSNLIRGSTKSCGCLQKERTSKARKENLAGQVFGRLLAISDSGLRKSEGIVWESCCECGNLVYIRGDSLKNGNTKSCGCLRRDRIFKHGYSKTRLYKIWIDMKRRCHNSNNLDYKNYGKRGIRVCDEWESNFTVFRDWALANGYKKNLTIDRIDSHKNYEPQNCQWLTNSENVRKANLQRKENVR